MTLALNIIPSLSAVNEDEWNQMAGCQSPLTSHQFLKTLEDSGCVDGESGWISQHLDLKKDGHTVAACPAYVKLHSYGEYVFDWNWAESYQNAGGHYYPKIQVAVPFTPVTGKRLLGQPEYYPMLARGLTHLCETMNLSGAHVTFCEPAEAKALEDYEFLTRYGLQFHWPNRDYKNFNDFLITLKSGKRKTIRKERQTAQNTGLRFVRLQGDDIKEHHWDYFFGFYQDTSDRKWGDAYLTRDFFSILHETMRHRILLCMAYDSENPIAGALNLIDQNRLLGRYWGCSKQLKCLHFELCYYQAIEYAIEHKLAMVEAGAQGEHKLHRGYVPTLTYSSHFLRDPSLRRAVNSFLQQERQAIDAQRAYLDTSIAPYAHTQA